MATGGKDRSTRAERERARLYQARLTLHADQQRRRSRDNLIAGIVGGLVILAIVGGQVAYFAAGPGAPAPEPSPSSTSSPTPSPSEPTTPTPEPSTTP